MDPLWVIVEGPDGAGKSYVAKECAHILASHGGGRPERPCVLQKLSYDSPREDYIWDAGEMHLVQDRGVISGPVYEPIMRGNAERMTWMTRLVDDAIREGAAVIWVDAHNARLEERLRERGDDYITVDKLLDIQAGYEKVMARWIEHGGTARRIDTTHEFPSRLQLELTLSSLAAR